MYTELLSEDYEVDTASTGAEAIKKSHEKYFNVALIDIVLPDMDGVSLIKGLKEGVPRLRKVLITGHASLDNAVRALNLGADAYMIKPVHSRDLLKAVKEQLIKQENDLALIQAKVVEYINKTIDEKISQLQREKPG